jgi:hypothetical protein
MFAGSTYHNSVDSVQPAMRAAGLLEAMHAHFAAPPPAVLDAWDPLAALDAAEMDPDVLLNGARPATALRLLAPPQQLADAVSGASTLLQLPCLLNQQPQFDVLPLVGCVHAACTLVKGF